MILAAQCFCLAFYIFIIRCFGLDCGHNPGGCEEGHQECLTALSCKECGRQFNKRSGTLFPGMKYTPQEVAFALRLRFKYRLSIKLGAESRKLNKFFDKIRSYNKDSIRSK